MFSAAIKVSLPDTLNAFDELLSPLYPTTRHLYLSITSLLRSSRLLLYPYHMVAAFGVLAVPARTPAPRVTVFSSVVVGSSACAPSVFPTTGTRHITITMLRTSAITLFRYLPRRVTEPCFPIVLLLFSVFIYCLLLLTEPVTITGLLNASLITIL